MTELECYPNEQPYELFVFSRRHGIGLDSARTIIARFGRDRPGADAAAKLVAQSSFQKATNRH